MNFYMKVSILISFIICCCSFSNKLFVTAANKIFNDSIHKKFPWKAARNKVYRDSVMQTFWLAFIYWFHKVIGTWNMCQRFLVQTNFTKNIFRTVISIVLLAATVTAKADSTWCKIIVGQNCYTRPVSANTTISKK